LTVVRANSAVYETLARQEEVSELESEKNRRPPARIERKEERLLALSSPTPGL